MALLSLTQTSSGTSFSLDETSILRIYLNGAKNIVEYVDEASSLKKTIEVDESASSISSASSFLVQTIMNGGTVYFGSKRIITVEEEDSLAIVSYQMNGSDVYNLKLDVSKATFLAAIPVVSAPTAAFNPQTMLADGNNEFTIAATAIASINLDITPVHGANIIWELLDITTDHNSSFYTSLETTVGQKLQINYPAVKTVLYHNTGGDERLSLYGVIAGQSVGTSLLEINASRDAGRNGFSLTGNGTNWTATGDGAAELYDLNALTAGVTSFNIKSGTQSFDAKSVQIQYVGTNNYRIRRITSGIPGTAGMAFIMVDVATNADITTAPVAGDLVVVTGYATTRQAIRLDVWIQPTGATAAQTSSNGFMNFANTNFWCFGYYELWMKVWSVSTTENSVRWQTKSGVTTYNLYRDVNSDLSTKALIYSGTDLEFADTGLTADTQYYYELEDQTNTEITRFNSKTKA